MSDPGTDPNHDLTEQPQDDERRPYRVRLGTFLALLRVLAGRRGHASVAWNSGGFTYVVTVEREQAPGGVIVDSDPDAPGRVEAARRLRDALAAPAGQPVEP